MPPNVSGDAADKKIAVLVVGAGLAGLAAALSIQDDRYQVTVIEAARELAEIGAGVQVTAQTIHSFERWGIRERLEPLAAAPVSWSILRYSDGSRIAHNAEWGKWQRDNFGYPSWSLHRADLQQAMYQRALEMGVHFQFGSPLESLDSFKGRVTLKDGQVFSADLVIAADGIHSRVRDCVLGRPDPALPTGDLAYRIVLSSEQITDPELRSYMENPAIRLWVGPQSHAIMYSLKGGKQMNIVLLVPDNLPETVKRSSGSVEEMYEFFHDWDPLLRRYLALVDRVEKWRLMHHKGLQTWTDGKVIMIGDAVHPMLPYCAQGANSAIEDGSTLGECLHRIAEASDIPLALDVFERVRKLRGERTVALTHHQRKMFHMPDGPEQQERDRIVRQQEEVGRDGNFPFATLNPVIWGSFCSYDPVAEVAAAWNTRKGDPPPSSTQLESSNSSLSPDASPYTPLPVWQQALRSM